MNVASLELCKELYELSGWRTEDWFDLDMDGAPIGVLITEEDVSFSNNDNNQYLPAYDLGYLLRKLQPLSEERGRFFLSFNPVQDRWFTGFSATYDQYHSDKGDADTPEDAACKLAIELWKQGILTKGIKERL